MRSLIGRVLLKRDGKLLHSMCNKGWMNNFSTPIQQEFHETSLDHHITTMSDGSKIKTPPWGLHWRSNTVFIIATVAIGLFTDLFLYGLIVPVMPFMLHRRLSIPEDQIQSYVSGLLAAYAGASVLFAFPAGWVADRTNSRQAPFLSGLASLLVATIMLALGRSVALLIVSRVLQGISAAAVWTIGLAMVMDTVGPSNMGKVVGTVWCLPLALSIC